MSRLEGFGETQDVEITVLVDNWADLLLESTESVKRYTREPLLAEHGFAALIQLKGERVSILWDAGITSMALMENARRMGIDLVQIEKIALSHGHGDHTAAMADVLKAMGAQPRARKWGKDVTMQEIGSWIQDHKVPLIAHPAAFRERWAVRKDGSKFGPGVPPPRAVWEAAGADIILSEDPYQLASGCWTTGVVPRLSFERAGTPPTRAYREGDELVRDYLEDDQSIVIHVEDKGLVVVSGCAHAGIVNTVNYAREISGVGRVWAILGGFHLAPATDEEIQRTIDEIRRMRPRMVVPSHCTGFRAIAEFSRQMPDEFVLGAVGTTYLF
jgi:7,8-dihydropterin-6-yl-methyl-4-(beta-D-ribofuranosyl)aminobenzene 5'-phosphate synthase